MMNNIVRIKKADADKQIAYGEVYAPNVLDTHGEFMLAEDIEKMAHRAMKRISEGSFVVDEMHDNEDTGSYLVESFIARKGDPDYTEGAWVIGVKINDTQLWSKIKKGEYNGFSFEGMIQRVETVITVELFKHNIGQTEISNNHQHIYFVELNDQGRVVKGITSLVEGHTHEIKFASVTEKADNHTHRYFINQSN